MNKVDELIYFKKNQLNYNNVNIQNYYRVDV